jgi:hypothetical protein
MVYFIEAETAEHATDEVVMRDSGSDKDFFDEAMQEHIGEHIFSAEKISQKRFNKILEAEKAKGFKSGMSHWLKPEVLIRKVDYGVDFAESDEEHTSRQVFKSMGSSLIMGRPSISDEDKFNDH